MVRLKDSDKEIKNAADLPKDKYTLMDLGVGSTPATDADLIRLKELKDLRRLSLDHTQVTDAGLTHLKPLVLNWLSLHSTKVTDVGLVHLKELDALGGLGLFDTQVTDVGLAHLKDIKFLKHLKELGLESTGFLNR